MAVHCNEDDVDALDFAQSSAADSINLGRSKSRKEQFGYFERMLRAGSQTRE